MKTVKDLLEKFEESARYDENAVRAEDRKGRDLRITKVDILNGQVIFHALPFGSPEKHLDREDIEEALACATQDMGLKVVLPEGQGNLVYDVMYIGNGCADYVYLSPRT